MTPMMAQYRRIKGELPREALLLFRLGDFYEMFFEDAKIGAPLLNVALTKRGDIPMCGIPFHAANGYIARILRAGRKVAICDQTEDAKPGKLVNREVTQILSAIEHGDPRAAEQLLPLVYDALRRLAAQKMVQESSGQTLQATALVHEVYLRLVASEKGQHWDSRGHFFAAAAAAMRRILIESARHKQTQKLGGDWHRIELADVEPAAKKPTTDVLALNEALEKLEAKDPRKATLIKLRYFAGLSVEEAAAVLGISRATAARHWDYARSWLYGELRDRGSEERAPKKTPRT